MAYAAVPAPQQLQVRLCLAKRALPYCKLQVIHYLCTWKRSWIQQGTQPPNPGYIPSACPTPQGKPRHAASLPASRAMGTAAPAVPDTTGHGNFCTMKEEL